MTTIASSSQDIMYKASVIGASAHNNKLEVIFCIKNCEKTIGYTISTAQKSRSFQQGNSITIVIDGFSTDDTREVAVKASANLVVQQPSNKFPGKGISMKTGFGAAIKA